MDNSFPIYFLKIINSPYESRLLMSISTSISPLLVLLEQNSDPGVAYFSYGVDEHGERGIIRANKEGLRLYAIDLLRKSMQMEAIQDGKNICFQPYDWLVCEAGYNLISAVKPEYASRAEIIASQNAPATKQPGKSSKGFFSWLLVWAAGLFSIGAVAQRP